MARKKQPAPAAPAEPPPAPAFAGDAVLVQLKADWPANFTRTIDPEAKPPVRLVFEPGKVVEIETEDHYAGIRRDILKGGLELVRLDYRGGRVPRPRVIEDGHELAQVCETLAELRQSLAREAAEAVEPAAA